MNLSATPIKYLLLATMVITRSGRGGSRAVSGFASSSSKSSRTKENVIARSAIKNAKPTTMSKSKKVASSTRISNKASNSIKKTTKKETESIATKKKYKNKLEEIKNMSNLLLSLPDDCIMGELQQRPSKRNRSPYVGDVWIPEQQRLAIVHLPNLDMGGKCAKGAKLLLKPARDRKGNLVGKDAVNPKYGTPKCEFIAQLLRVDESELGYDKCWVGAHPSLGEKIAEQLVERNLLGPSFPTVKSFKREVRNVGGTDMRVDFVIEHEDPDLPPRLLEVKTVVDTDYSSSLVLPNRTKCVFTSDEKPYRRTAIFPYGNSKQKGPDGEPVVSERAIKHVRELTRMVVDDSKQFDCTVLFVIIRHDAKAFRPNVDACPSFTRYLREAKEKGVQILAKQVVWGEEKNIGQCFEGNLLDVVWP